jgi:hypothetical protein
VTRDQLDSQESRLWDRARLNLMLLYGGRRGTSSTEQVSGSGGIAGPFGNVVLDI